MYFPLNLTSGSEPGKLSACGIYQNMTSKTKYLFNSIHSAFASNNSLFIDFWGEKKNKKKNNRLFGRLFMNTSYKLQRDTFYFWMLWTHPYSDM